MKRDFLAITDFSSREVEATLELAKKLKRDAKRGKCEPLLRGKTLAMVFEKPSARTRVSFEVGMFQLGGHALYLGPNEIGLGKRESVADVARVLSRYCDGIMARLFGHEVIEELARFASVPVINGLTDLLHPCQVMGDVLTIMEHKGRIEGLKVAWVGDGNNVANSWLNMASRLPFTLHLACPEGYDPNEAILARAKGAGVSEVKLFRDPKEAVRGADVIYTDVWASMGQEAEAEVRKKVFRPYQVNEELVAMAAPDCIVMHCLPAHRGDEITDAVIDGPHSVVFDEAENRLHVQKAIMVTLMRA
ncbi:MAG: ornithine carbamoyltransferase [candidate division KSB1 bacterium]|nr:ornithine carbamoyltransferase [candidate division KSB1 bacterium]